MTRRLTAAQRDLWLLAQDNPTDPSYHVPFAFWVDGPLDAHALTNALNAVIARHEALRTVITVHHGEPVAEVLDELRLTCAVLPASEPQAVAAAEKFSAEPFDGPLLRARLYRVAEDRHLLVLVLHHLICDGSSLWIILADLATCYSGDTLPPAPRFTGTPADTGAARRIADRIASAPDVVNLPYDLGTPRPGPASGRVLLTPIPADTNDAIERMAREHAVTANAVLLAAYATVLEVVTGVDDILVSIPVSLRRTPEQQRAVGYLVHSVPMRLRPGAHDTVTSLVAHCAQELRQAWADAGASFGEVVERVRPQRVPGLNPLCQCEFSSQTVPARLPSLGQATLRYQYIHNGGYKIGLSAEVVQQGGSRTLAVEYPADLFLPTTINRIARLLLRVLRQMAETPAMALSGLDLTATAEREWLARRTGTPDLTRHPALEERIGQWITERPATTAVIDATSEISYERLGSWSAEVAESLRQAGVRPGDRVALHGPRTCRFVVAAVAVMRMGASLVALADDLPAGRIARVLAVARPAAIIVTSEGLLQIESRPCPAGWLAPLPDPAAHPGEAYVVLTSGSSGDPRGVSVPRTALAAVVAAWGELLDLAAWPGRHLQLAPFSFDVFIGDLGRALGFGGTLVLARREEILDPIRLLDLIDRHGVDTGEFVPAVVRLLLDTVDRLPLRRMMVGSDAWSVDEASALLRALPSDAELYCTYGTSEAAIDSTSYRVTPSSLPARGGVPIGTPLAGTLVSVRDRRGRVVPPGLPGELWLGGAGVASGYLDENGEPVRRQGFTVPGWYRSGDRALWGRTGELSLLGRLDDETKVRGVRVDPGEVEAVLRAHPSVRVAAVVVTDAEPERRQLAAFLTGPSDVDEVARYAREHLPAAVVPAIWRVVDRVPMTRNGKVDRRALVNLAADTGGARPAAALTSIEAVVAAIWRDVLDVAEVGPADDFFALGGSSIQAARVAWRVGTALGVHVTVADIVRRPSVRDLCGSFDTAEPEPDVPALAGVTFCPPPGSEPWSGRIVLTGATGTLGAGILARLLVSPVAEIHCLVRPGRLLRDAFQRYGADPALLDDPRLTVYPADLTAPDAGLSPEHLNEVLRADAVVNAAAWVNFVYPYEKLAPVNVRGVITLARWAGTAKAKALHHLSTQSAVPTRGEQLRGGYNQTKAAADEVIRRLAAVGTRTSLYRPGFVLGKLTGTPRRAGLLESFLRECLRLGRAPELPGCVAVVTADHVARTIVGNVLAERPESVVDILAEPALKWTAVWDLVRDRGLPLDIIPADRWIGDVSADALWFEPFLPLLNEVPLAELFDDLPTPTGAMRAAEPAEQVWHAICDQLADAAKPTAGRRF
ncbi:condensation domain-containing protein [Actinocrispum sp. NPDC049592]|uniref:non-ribosomal peptide synthetase n=1 Tax=Actinocrispum sp. NPDC049592 TaxID=3154835 RepID=UPI00343CA63E